MLQLPYRGVNISLGNKKKIPSIAVIIHSLKLLRVSWVRLEFDFLHQHSVFDYVTLINALVNEGITIIGVLLPLVPGKLTHILWGDMKSTYRYDIHKDAFSDFSEHIISQFSSYISYWQIWNEQNTKRFWGKQPNPQEYAQCFIDIYDRCYHYTKPGTRIAGSIMGNDTQHLKWFQYPHFYKETRSLLPSDQQNALAARAIQPYFSACYIGFQKKEYYLAQVISLIETSRRDFSCLSNKPIWITEWGVSSRWTSMQVDDIAWIYTSLGSYCASHNTPLLIWGLLSTAFDGMHSWNPERYFGLLHEEGSMTSLGLAVAKRLAKYSDKWTETENSEHET